MNEEQAQPPAPTAGSHRRKLVLVLVLVLLAVGVFVHWLSTRGHEVTDDAQIVGHLVPISPRVSGYVDVIAVKDNQHVRAGRLLVQLDRRDLLAKLHQEEANLANNRAQARAAGAQVSLTEKTGPAGEQQATAGVGLAGAGVAASESQISVAEAQARAADADVVAVRSAVDTARTEIDAAKAQVTSAEEALAAAEAEATSAQARADKSAADAARYRQLFQSGAVSKDQVETFDTANTAAQSTSTAAKDRARGAKAMLNQARARERGVESALRQAQARLKAAQASAAQAHAAVGLARTGKSQAEARLRQSQAAERGAKTVPQQLSINTAQHKAAVAKINQALANVRAAKLQLSYTRIVAPVDGVVSKRSVEPGQYVQAGQALMAIVPLRGTWVVANYKETQTGHMRRGQHVVISVDAYPGVDFAAHVESVGAGTGAVFSLLPPENATGNFVKVVQRVPVKIVFDRPLPKGVVLRPGMNVTANVRID